MSAIFLSYRRDDSSGYAGRLFDNLAERFGRERVFMDIETLEPGMDFVTGIDRAIESCGAVIALIGPNWLEARDSEGRRRLENPHDFIRLEITTALKRGVRVIPILVHNASMPPEQELPEPLQPLCRLQACEISDNRWEYDAHRLTDVLEPLIAEPAQAPATSVVAPAATGATPVQGSGSRHSAWLAAVAVAVVGIAGGVWWLNQPTSSELTPPPVDETVTAPPEAAPSEPVVTTLPPPPVPVAPAPATGLPSPETPLPAEEVAEPVVEPPPEPLAVPVPPVVAEPFTAPVPREPSPDELRQHEIDELIQAAETDLAALRLTRPAGNNALERFQRVLELEPHNLAARDGLNAIVERYHRLVESALASAALARAQRHLDAARAIEPRAEWLAPMQREINQRRHVAAQPERTPERSSRSGQADREACLSACERNHEACRAEIDGQAEADCLRERAKTCEQRYQSCMSDTGKIFMGPAALESECAGVHSRCSNAAAKDCAIAPQTAQESCDTRFETCSQRCRNSN